ncbi:MAG: T9SS type A sorting domain-containing protein [Xanthomarina gelatinilytica]|nr:T9SS type A sorting domain-containing protein [Xanthomarina gelatinilytica]
MKTYYYIFALLIGLNSFSQNEIQGEWFLHYINIENTQQYSTIPNSINTFNIDSETTFYGNICSNGYAGSYVFNNDNTISITNFSALGGFCSYEFEEDLFLNPYMWSFLGLYTDDPIFSYELNGTGINETLKLIHSNGNYVFYGRQELALDTSLLGDWYLHTITAYGNPPITTSPYNYRLNFTIDNSNFNLYDNEGEMKCNAYWASSTIPSPNVLELIFGGATLAFCEPSEEDLYLHLLTDHNNSGTMLHAYNITGTSNNAILTLTNSDNNVLVFGRQTLSNPTFTERKSIKITQNPVHEELKISTENDDFENLSYSIHSMEGKIIIEKEGLSQNKINVSYLETGVYFLVVSDKNSQQHVLKFIKE